MSSRITKTDLVNKVSNHTGESKQATSRIINSLISVIQSELKQGNDVAITGFLTLKTVEKPERTARNPKANASITIPKRKVVKVSIGSELRDVVNL